MNTKIETLCLIRDLYRAINDFEIKFFEKHNLCLNEGMLLCALQSEELTSGEIAEILNLTASNTSKVIRSVEEKGLISRVMGKKDKRQMFFSLSPDGRACLESLRTEKVEMPPILSKFLQKRVESKIDINHPSFNE